MLLVVPATGSGLAFGDPQCSIRPPLEHPVPHEWPDRYHRGWRHLATHRDDQADVEPAMLRPTVGGRVPGRHDRAEATVPSGRSAPALALTTAWPPTVVSQFTGLNMVITLSSMQGLTFVDVFRVNDEGLIVEHLETTPKQSPNRRHKT
jgi:hypothetical protein